MISPLSFLDLNNGLRLAAGFIGSCLVIYHGYMFFYPPDEEKKVVHEMVTTNLSENSTPSQETKVNIDME